MHLGTLRKSEAATTLTEVLVASVLVAVFFATIYEVNAVCLRYISASKENVAAIECVQDRIEQLRNLDFGSLTNGTTVATAMAAPSNASVLAQQATEDVIISTFSAASGAATTPKVQYHRVGGGAASTTWTGGPGFGTATIVQVDVTYTWTSTFGGHTRSEQTSTILAAGTKK